MRVVRRCMNLHQGPPLAVNLAQRRLAQRTAMAAIAGGGAPANLPSHAVDEADVFTRSRKAPGDGCSLQTDIEVQGDGDQPSETTSPPLPDVTSQLSAALCAAVRRGDDAALTDALACVPHPKGPTLDRCTNRSLSMHACAEHPCTVCCLSCMLTRACSMLLPCSTFVGLFVPSPACFHALCFHGRNT